MLHKGNYSAEEVAGVLRSAGYEITRRTVNYYAFEKKMFQPGGQGKKIFTRSDIDKIQAILFLREQGTMALDKIKTVINQENFSLPEIERRYSRHKAKLQSFAGRELIEEYPLEIYDKHIIVDIDHKKVLFGTGASKSIGKPAETGAPSLKLLGYNYNLDKSFLGASVESISEMLGTPIDVLLGGDILGKLYATIDLDNGLAVFTNQLQENKGQPLPVEMVLQVPMVEMTLAEKKHKLFLDTGAKVSFLRKELIKDYPHVGREKDFYPGIGRFDVDTYEIPVKIAGVNVSVNFGSLPDLLEMALLMAGCDGILGYDIFRHFNPLYFNLPGKLISLTRRSIPLE